MRLDRDIKVMTEGQAHQELMRIRRLLRTHRDRSENSRCWHADAELYARVLPESKPPGRMDLPKEVLLKQCGRYIDHQQCQHIRCPGFQTTQTRQR